MNTYKKHIAKTTIKTRGTGWTETAINRFLGEPDKTGRNPHYSSSEPMKLYSEERVLAIEETDEFNSFVTKNDKRKSASKINAEKTVQTKIKKVAKSTTIQEEVTKQAKRILDLNKKMKQRINILKAKRAAKESGDTLTVLNHYR